MIISADDDFTSYTEKEVHDEDHLVITLSEYPKQLMLVKVVITKIKDTQKTKISYDFTKSTATFSMKEADSAVLNVHYSQFKIKLANLIIAIS